MLQPRCVRSRGCATASLDFQVEICVLVEAEEADSVARGLLDDLARRALHAASHQLDQQRQRARLVATVAALVPALLRLWRHALHDACNSEHTHTHTHTSHVRQVAHAKPTAII